jgi:hypothetical protein
MIKVRVTNKTDLERAYAGIQLTSGSSVEKTLDENTVDFLEGTTFTVERLEENVTADADAGDNSDAEEAARTSNLADAQAFDAAQRLGGDVNEVDAGDDGLISGNDVETFYGVSEEADDDPPAPDPEPEPKDETPAGATE